MKINLNGRSWFPQVTRFLTFLYITGLSIKITFSNSTFITLGSKCYYRQDLYYAWVQNVITDGTFITLGSKCYYRWDLYYTWVQLLHLCLLHHSTGLGFVLAYSFANGISHLQEKTNIPISEAKEHSVHPVKRFSGQIVTHLSPMNNLLKL